jgi:hypothetical protein
MEIEGKRTKERMEREDTANRALREPGQRTWDTESTEETWK